MQKFKRIELESRSIPEFQFTEEARNAPLGVVATAMLMQAPKNAKIYGERLPDGRFVLVVKEKTWVEQKNG